MEVAALDGRSSSMADLQSPLLFIAEGEGGEVEPGSRAEQVCPPGPIKTKCWARKGPRPSERTTLSYAELVFV